MPSDRDRPCRPDVATPPTPSPARIVARPWRTTRPLVHGRLRRQADRQRLSAVEMKGDIAAIVDMNLVQAALRNEAITDPVIRAKGQNRVGMTITSAQ